MDKHKHTHTQRKR